ncbi:hypothetical protein JL720_3332 [Aureococcus anophagefferens]|nr:hypothetical protein JL720_3332 [Aureococcus anophagefferens]
MPRNASDSMDLDNFKHAPKIKKKRWKGAPPKLRSIRSHDPYQPYLPEVPALGGMTSPATVLSRGKTPDLRSVTFDGATAGLRGGGAPAAALELLSRSELTAWHLSLQNETQSFNSLAIYGELRLREALLLETDPDEFYSNAPHTVVAALAGDLLLKLTTLYRRFSSFTQLLSATTLRCVFSDYERTILPDMEANGGRTTARRSTPRRREGAGRQLCARWAGPRAARPRHPGIPEGDKEKALRERGERDAKDHALENVLDDFAVAESLPEDPAEAREALELRIRLAFEAGYKLGKDQGGPRFVTGKAPPPKKAPPPPPPPAAAPPAGGDASSLLAGARRVARSGGVRATLAEKFGGGREGRRRHGKQRAAIRAGDGDALASSSGDDDDEADGDGDDGAGGADGDGDAPRTLLEEALRADVTAANAEAQALGKKNLVAMIIAAMAVTQLPLRTIAMNCLIRRFGMRTLAVKKLRAVVATCHEAKTRSRHKRLEVFAAADLRSLGMLVRRYFKLLYHGVKGYVVAPATALARLLVGANRFDARLFAKAADEVIFHWTKECDPRAYDERRRQLEELARADDADATNPPWMDCDEAILLCSGFARHERAFEDAYVREKKAARALQRACRAHATRRRHRQEQTAKWTALWNGRARAAAAARRARRIFHAAEMDFYNEHVLSEDKEIHLARMLEGARGEDVNRLAFLETVVDAHGLVVGSASAKDQLRAQVRATARLSKVKRASQFLKQSATKRQSAIKEQSGDFARRYSEVEERVEHMRASHDDGRAGPELLRKAHGAGGEPGSAHATPHASPGARTLADS